MKIIKKIGLLSVAGVLLGMMTGVGLTQFTRNACLAAPVETGYPMDFVLQRNLADISGHVIVPAFPDSIGPGYYWIVPFELRDHAELWVWNGWKTAGINE
jgi:hypothetical protein